MALLEFNRPHLPEVSVPVQYLFWSVVALAWFTNPGDIQGIVKSLINSAYNTAKPHIETTAGGANELAAAKWNEIFPNSPASKVSQPTQVGENSIGCGTGKFFPDAIKEVVDKYPNNPQLQKRIEATATMYLQLKDKNGLPINQAYKVGQNAHGELYIVETGTCPSPIDEL